MAVGVSLLFSYILDWVVVVVVAAAGGVLNYINGFHRPFSLTDMSIAYPYKADIVSLPVLVIVSLVVPSAIIVVLNFGMMTISHHSHEPHRMRRVAWETHTGLLGLCAGLAVTLFVTSGLKDMVGKPRPDLLARCDADLSAITQFLVGGFGNSLNSEAAVLVSSGICQQSDTRVLDDGFASFPSGHSSFSSAGMVYLSLWLCARFSVRIPYLDLSYLPSSQQAGRVQMITAERDRQAAPPVWQTALALSPIVAALFICASRYADFHHAGFDIISGAAIGTVFGWASFRIYHLPIRRGHGLLAWGPRPRRCAFFISKEDDGIVDVEYGGVTNYELSPYRSAGPERAPTDSSSRPIFTSRNNPAQRK